MNKFLFLSASALLALTAFGQDYPINFAGEDISHGSRSTSSISILSTSDGEESLNTGQTNKGALYTLIESNCFTARPGDRITPSFGFNGGWMNGYVYIDYNNDGAFDFAIQEDGKPAEGSELVSYSHYNGKNSSGSSVSGNTLTMPKFKIPETTPCGIYRMRFKVDWDNIDPAGNNSEGNSIIANGGIIADAMLLIHDGQDVALNVEPVEFGALASADGSALPEKIAQAQPWQFKPVPDNGYMLKGLTLIHSIDAEVQHGNINSFEIAFDRDYLRSVNHTIPANCISGDQVTLIPSFVSIEEYAPGSDKYEGNGYELVWADEFNGEDGSHPDFDKKWINSPRRTSTWNKRNSSREDLYVIQDGILHLYAKPNDDTSTDNAPMITAAMETTGKFFFTHGIVEARIKINPHTGNFPAFWMMPETGFNGGWPFCGEIDIMEQINNENRTYHTLHGYWTNDKSMSVSNTWGCDVKQFHDYTLQWIEDGFKWYVDGTEVFKFHKSKYNSDKYPYPFDRPFHIILNQAVGDGSWAANYDPNHTYELEIDYVRVYQKVETLLKGVNVDAKEINITPMHGSVKVETSDKTLIDIYHISGAKLKSVIVDGSDWIDLPAGIYVINNQKVMVR